MDQVWEHFPKYFPVRYTSVHLQVLRRQLLKFDLIYYIFLALDVEPDKAIGSILYITYTGLGGSSL